MAGSSLSGGGTWPKIISQDKSSKLGFIVTGNPKPSVKNFCVGICQHGVVMDEKLLGS